MSNIFRIMTFYVRGYVCSKSCFRKRCWWPFVDLIKSKGCLHVCKLFNLSDIQKVAKPFFQKRYFEPENNPAGGLRQIKVYLEPENRPAGGWIRSYFEPENRPNVIYFALGMTQCPTLLRSDHRLSENAFPM